MRNAKSAPDGYDTSRVLCSRVAVASNSRDARESTRVGEMVRIPQALKISSLTLKLTLAHGECTHRSQTGQKRHYTAPGGAYEDASSDKTTRNQFSFQQSLRDSWTRKMAANACVPCF